MKKKFTKTEGKLFYLRKELRRIRKKLENMLPYVDKATHKELESIIFELKFAIHKGAK